MPAAAQRIALERLQVEREQPGGRVVQLRHPQLGPERGEGLRLGADLQRDLAHRQAQPVGGLDREGRGGPAHRLERRQRAQRCRVGQMAGAQRRHRGIRMMNVDLVLDEDLLAQPADAVASAAGLAVGAVDLAAGLAACTVPAASAAAVGAGQLALALAGAAVDPAAGAAGLAVACAAGRCRRGAAAAVTGAAGDAAQAATVGAADPAAAVAAGAGLLPAAAVGAVEPGAALAGRAGLVQAQRRFQPGAEQPAGQQPTVAAAVLMGPVLDQGRRGALGFGQPGLQFGLERLGVGAGGDALRQRAGVRGDDPVQLDPLTGGDGEVGPGLLLGPELAQVLGPEPGQRLDLRRHHVGDPLSSPCLRSPPARHPLPRCAAPIAAGVRMTQAAADLQFGRSAASQRVVRARRRVQAR